jgi:hypothetical protein
VQNRRPLQISRLERVADCGIIAPRRTSSAHLHRPWHDLWDSNRPGSTLFLPVCDVSASLISLIAHFVDPALRATRLRTAA